jgi:alkaline phosphatase
VRRAERAGYRHAPCRTTLLAQAAQADKMLGLFAYSNMNVAFDKIGHRRQAWTIVEDHGFPDQPMLGEAAGSRPEWGRSTAGRLRVP